MTTGDPKEDVVALRTLVVGGLPLLVASVSESGRGPRLRQALSDAGLVALPAFLGHELPRGARVGFQLDRVGLQLVDERENALLRAPRNGLDQGWLEAAGRLKGTMLVLLSGSHPDPDLDPRALVETVEQRAAQGQARGAIVGVVDDRMSLPMVF